MPTPTPGQDYPRTWNEFLDWFATEEACQAFLEKLRWPQGFVCPRCGNAGDVYRASRTRLMCRSCQYQGTVTSGTIFDKTRTPLRVWLAAAWYLTNQKQGVSALGLQRVLGLGATRPPGPCCTGFDVPWSAGTSSRGLWRWMKRTCPSRIARIPPPAGRKSSTTKVLMVMAVEIVEPKGFGRIRLRSIDRDAATHVIPFVQEVVEPEPRYARMVRRHTALWENWVTPTSAPSCSAQAYLPMSPWRECTGSPHWYSAGCWEHIMALYSQTTWTPISMNSCSVSTGAHPAHAGCCFTACCSKRWLRQ